MTITKIEEAKEVINSFIVRFGAAIKKIHEGNAKGFKEVSAIIDEALVSSLAKPHKKWLIACFTEMLTNSLRSLAMSPQKSSRILFKFFIVITHPFFVKTHKSGQFAAGKHDSTLSLLIVNVQYFSKIFGDASGLNNYVAEDALLTLVERTVRSDTYNSKCVKASELLVDID